MKNDDHLNSMCGRLPAFKMKVTQCLALKLLQHFHGLIILQGNPNIKYLNIFKDLTTAKDL